MTIHEVVTAIRLCLSDLNKAYGGEVFDEFSIVSLNKNLGEVLFYFGAREQLFLKTFNDDMLLLRKEILKDQPESGDFGFTREGAGSYYDAFICIAPNLYIIFNNTLKSMDEITENTRWLAAQSSFLKLSQLFSANTVTIDPQRSLLGQ